MYRKNRTQKRQLKKKNGYTLVCKIYANWCGHCQQLKPEWDTMKSLIKNKENKDIEIVEFEENEKPAGIPPTSFGTSDESTNSKE